MDNWRFKALNFCKLFNSAFLVYIALFIFLVPGIIVLNDLSDPNIRSGVIPKSAWRLHRSLTPRYARWAKQRLESSRATELTTVNISGTEWPLFGSVFYLWATESLQDAWEKDNRLAVVAPKVFAKDAIETATQLVIDPKQANWVKIHWGTNYLKTENVFYRMLVISALTSHARLTGDRQHLPFLKDQVESLSAELDASPHGILNDYPNECYPGDVLTAIAMIHRADKVLGTDHSAFINRAIRGFSGDRLASNGLVAYSSSARLGTPIAPSRGCGNSYVSLFAPEIWPEQAQKWYDLYTHDYWQEVWACAGFREFRKGLLGHEWYVDVDSGPVLKGYGCSACAYGVGAARVNGHFEHAFPLTAELLVTVCPMPDGKLLLPRLLSNAADAPYLGESAILFNLTRTPVRNFPIHTGGSIPKFVVIFLTLQLGLGFLLALTSIKSFHRWRTQHLALTVPHPGIQEGIWFGLLIIAILCICRGKMVLAILALLCMQFLPRYPRKKPVDKAATANAHVPG
jgi:hypothetical protein